jgi:hypothetical protein
MLRATPSLTPALRGAGWLVPALALAALVPRCGNDAGGDASEGASARGGDGGGEDGGSPGSGGAIVSGGQGGAPETGGTSTGGVSTGGTESGRGGSAASGNGGAAGEPSSGSGGEGETGGTGAAGGTGGAGGMPAGGEGGFAGEGGSAGEPGCHDPPSTSFCTNDLSGVGTGDFEVKFTIEAWGQQPIYAVMGQREVCAHSHFWSARLFNGGLYFELDDNGQNYADCHSPIVLNDSATHRVVVRRTSGVLSIVVDCGPPTTCPAPTELSTPLDALGNQESDPCIGYGTAPLEGRVQDRCVRPL